jgi:sialic acid synthase SpsE
LARRGELMNHPPGARLARKRRPLLMATVIGEGHGDHRLGGAILRSKIARGAGLPEDRLTLHRNRPGGDQAPSMAPAGFADLIGLSVGAGVKTAQPGQGDPQRLPHEGRLAARAARKGDGLTEADIVRRCADSGLTAAPLAAPPGWLIVHEAAAEVLLDEPDLR